MWTIRLVPSLMESTGYRSTALERVELHVMDEDNVREYNFDQFQELQQWLGPRENGRYRIDPNYLRRGLGSKIYCWDDYAKKWRLVNPGDRFYKRSDGTVGHEKGIKS